MIQPIIVKKCRRETHHAHSSSWKVALADFMTALMTLFLLLWLIASTTPEQRAAIATQFQGEGVMPGSRESSLPEGSSGRSSVLIDMEGSRTEREMLEQQQIDQENRKNISKIYRQVKSEQARMGRLKRVLEQTIERSTVMSQFKDQILLQQTPEGLRVQIVDKKNRPMFDVGGSTPKPYTQNILKQLGATINMAPNRIAISGHTDASRYNRINYSNWELSSDRANAARRALIQGGMREQKIDRVVGLAATEPFEPDNPKGAANRRISILVMNRSAETTRYMDVVQP
jgi:chemotaxis protein MotB